MGLTWGQLGANLGPTWANLGQLGPIWNQLRPTWANMSQRRPTWVQFGASPDLKIIEKPLFFPGFSSIFKQPLKSFGTALGHSLGTPWGAFGDAWGALGVALGSFGAALGGLGETLGTPWGSFLEEPWVFLGRTSWKDLPEPTPARELLGQLSFR